MSGINLLHGFGVRKVSSIVSSWITNQSVYYASIVPSDATADAFVDFDSGSDSNDGLSWAQAKLTMQAAAALIQGTGGVIKVRGTHSGSQAQVTADGISSQYIEFWADTLYGAKVNGAGFNNAVNLWGDYQAVYGMEVYGSNYTGFRDSSSYVGKRLAYCYGHDPVWADAGPGGGALASFNAAGATVESSLVVGGTPSGGDAFATTLHGIYLKQGIARNNLVVDVRAGYGIHIWDSDPISDTEATNNTCLHCNSGGLLIKGSNLVAANNIVAYNNNEGGSGGGLGLRIYGPADGAVVTNNLYYQNQGSDFLDSSTDSVVNQNPVTTDPDFVNYQADGSGDYRVSDTGGAYQGASSTYAPTLDFYGNTRSATPTIGFAEVETSGGVPVGGGGDLVTSLDGVGSASTSYTDYPVTADVTTGDYYVDSTVGSSGVGTSLVTAFKTIQEGLSALSDGQTLIVKGDAEYAISSTITRSTSWATGIEVYAYGTDRPVLNFSGLSSTSYGINFTGANEHWKGFEIKNTPIHAVRITGSDYWMEDMLIHHVCTDATDSYSAMYLYGSGCTNCLIQDVVAYAIGPIGGSGTDVCDVLTATTTGGAGNYTTGHTFVRCVGAYGPDDVYDLFLARNTDLIDCVAVKAGYHYSDGDQGGDGNGFKMGGLKSGGSGGGNTAQGCISVYAKTTGFTVNGSDPHAEFINCTATENTRGFILDPTSSDEPNIARNCLSTDNPTYNLSKTEPINDTFNSWNLGIGNGQADYVAASYDWSLDTGSPAIDAASDGGNLGASEVALALAKYWIPIIEAAI